MKFERREEGGVFRENKGKKRERERERGNRCVIYERRKNRGWGRKG